MFLPRAALSNPQFSLVIIFLSIVLGIASYQTIPRSEDPQFELAIVLIEVIYPGASPMDIETLVVDPIESRVSELEDIDKITSLIKDGSTRIEIRFLYGSDPDEAYDDVLRAISGVRQSLPSGVEGVFVLKGSPTAVSIIQLAMGQEQNDYKQISLYAEQLEKRLEQFPSIRKADIWGLPPQIVEVQLDQNKLLQYKLSVQQVLQAITDRSRNITPGFVDIQQRRFNLRASGNYATVQQVQDTIVTAGMNSSIRVSDIAQVSFASDQPTSLAFFNGKPVVFITAEQHSGNNIFDVTQTLENEIAKFKQVLPDDIQLETVFKQVDSVSKRVDGFFENLMQGLILVAIMALLFLGFREAFIIAITIPISIFIAIGWLDFAGFGLEQMSIVGLIIALGLMVDDAIVVTESIHRERRNQTSVIQAAAIGASRVGWASTSGSVTTILAFLPMLLLASDSGDFMRSMPVTVVLVLIASLLIGLTLTPLMAAWLLNKSQTPKYALQRVTEHFSHGYYQQFLRRVLNRPLLTGLLAVVILVALFSLFPKVGVSLFPKAEKPMLLIDIEAPNNTSLLETQRIVEEVSRVVATYPLIENQALNIGHANPRIYYNEVPRKGEANFGQIVALLTEYDSDEVTTLISELRQHFQYYPYAKVDVREFQQGPVTDPPITFRILGENIDHITTVATLLEQYMLQTPGLIRVKNIINEPIIEYRLDVDYERASLAGIDIAILEETVEAIMSGTQAGILKDSYGQDFPVIVKNTAPTLDILEQQRIVNQFGQLLPISQFVSMNYAAGDREFYHFQKIRMAKVTADADMDYSVNELTTKLVRYMEQLNLPPGVTYEIGGEEESRQRDFAGLSKVMLISAVGIFAVLVLQFKSLLQPAIIFTSVPFAIGGAVLGLYISGFSFSIMAFVGLISLFGIVVNNAIILVDTCNFNMNSGQTKYDAVINASATRFTPILLTTLTTIGGLIPLMVYGGNLWAPLSWVIVSGLIVSTLSSLIIVPILTNILTRKH